MSLVLLFLLTFSTADKIVKSPQITRSVNYEDFSLLCADGIPLLMEDHKPRPCQPRPWLQEQRCPTGFWCHEGQSEHSYYCCPSSRKFANRCHLPPAVGYGKQRMRRFYFDWKTDACHELQYSGIGGNENSFMDYEKCEQVCRGAGEPPISLPSNMKIMPKEVVEEKTKKPSAIVEKSEKKVVYGVEPPTTTRLPATIYTTKKKDEVYESFYTVPIKKTTTAPTTTTTTPTTSTTTTTPSTTTTTTTVTTTTEPSTTETLDPNPCVLTPDKGVPGQMTISMWYYDTNSASCSPFMYLGKGGNSNKFFTADECLETCAIGKPTRKSCELPPAIGNGPFNIPRYYFDKVTRRCERFFYSGRDGNDNRFYKKNKCERLCLRKKTKKKEHVPEFVTTTTTPLPPSTMNEHTPMRIIQNLIPVQTTSWPKTRFVETTTESTTTTPKTTQTMMHTDPYVYITSAPLTEEFWTEESTTAHPTLIYEPRGENFPTISPPQSTPSIVDHVFSNLMNSQQQKLVELVKTPVESTTIVPVKQHKFSSHEKIPFGQIEQQPVPMSAYGSAKPFENPYGMKVEPYQGTDYIMPTQSYRPQPPFQEVTEIPEVPEPEPEPSTTTPTPILSSTIIPTESTIPPTLVPYVPIQVGPPQFLTTTTTTTSAPPTQYLPDYMIPILFPHPIATLSPTARPPPTPSTTIPPLPTLLPPNVTYVTSPPEFVNDGSPCNRPIFGDATIMCENRLEICPIGTFCQIGQGQSICCPIMDEPPCEQSIEEGVGNSLLRRWYFDPATRLCQPFHYKGFKGNQNNFLSFDQCHRACGATNICPGGVPQLSIHTHLLSCNSDADCAFSHSCIQSTPHNLCCLTPIQPVQTIPPIQPEPTQENLVIDFILPSPSQTGHNPCDQQVDVGYGVLAEHRWAFANGQCSSFLYAGHGGNMNNFLTRNDCVRTCQPNELPSSPQCSQPASSGHGEQYLSRYFYSPEYHQCLHFIYSGESGNENNFKSLTDCLETCVANGVKFSSLASSPMSIIPPVPVPKKVCPQGDPLITVDGTPIQCDPSKAAKCPGDHVCTPVGNEAYCCPSPMNYCLQSRPAISVCPGPEFEPIREIRFTYDPMADRCIRFSFQNCRGSFAPSSAGTSSSSLNSFSSNSQCNRLCCNQGYNLVYKRRLLMTMNDDPLID